MVHFESDGGARDLADAIPEGPVLFIGSALARPELTDELSSRGIEVTKIPCYATLPATLSALDQRHVGEADVLFIGAPSAWMVASSFVSPSTLVVVPGETTASEVRRSHEQVLVGWGVKTREYLTSL